jgi:NADPH-dependent ferric siderophore reductase/SAM-dependent methyltransferase
MEQLPVRLIEVTDIKRITPHMARITFGVDDLADVTCDEPDQQAKLYFPKPGQAVPRLPEPSEDGDFMRWYESFTAIAEPERPWMRSYTIRAHHPQHKTIDIDFVLHADAGPATRWAQSAVPGDTLGMFGPSQTFNRPVPISTSIDTSDWLLLAGDETALPAIGTLIESLSEGARAVAYIEVGDAAEEQRFDTRGEVTVHWLHRGEVPAGHSDILVEAVRNARFPVGSMFAWLAGESGAVRALRRHLVDERGIDKRSIDFAGYWRLRLTQDDAPTEGDLADARELMAHAQTVDETAPSLAVFDQAYESHTAPWVIGEPQPAVVALERGGWIRGTVLDPGCGTGEHTIHLTRLGYDVLGIDPSEHAIEQARANAADHEVAARFELGDALDLGDEPKYDTVVDSALFHIFDPWHRTQYVRSLHRVCRPDAFVHVLALSDTGPGFGPEISDTVIREAFGEGWVLEDLRSSRYRGVVGSEGELGDLPAWMARVRRI